MYLFVCACVGSDNQCFFSVLCLSKLQSFLLLMQSCTCLDACPCFPACTKNLWSRGRIDLGGQTTQMYLSVKTLSAQRVGRVTTWALRVCVCQWWWCTPVCDWETSSEVRVRHRHTHTLTTEMNHWADHTAHSDTDVLPATSQWQWEGGRLRKQTWHNHLKYHV